MFFLNTNLNLDQTKKEKQKIKISEDLTIVKVKSMESFIEKDTSLNYTNFKPYEKEKFINASLNTNIY